MRLRSLRDRHFAEPHPRPPVRQRDNDIGGTAPRLLLQHCKPVPTQKMMRVNGRDVRDDPLKNRGTPACSVRAYCRRRRPGSYCPQRSPPNAPSPTRELVEIVAVIGPRSIVVPRISCSEDRLVSPGRSPASTAAIHKLAACIPCKKALAPASKELHLRAGHMNPRCAEYSYKTTQAVWFSLVHERGLGQLIMRRTPPRTGAFFPPLQQRGRRPRIHPQPAKVAILTWRYSTAYPRSVVELDQSNPRASDLEPDFPSIGPPTHNDEASHE